jgi:hypothetical protein
MEKISWTYSVKNEETLHRAKEDRNIRKANLIDHNFRRIYLLKHVVEGKARKKGASDGKTRKKL